MDITAVEFDPEELEYLIQTIDFKAINEPSTYLRDGYEFTINHMEFPAMYPLTLYVKVRMTEETTDTLPPDIGKRLCQDVDILELTLCNRQGDEIRSNLDWTFYERLKLELNTVKY